MKHLDVCRYAILSLSTLTAITMLAGCAGPQGSFGPARPAWNPSNAAKSGKSTGSNSISSKRSNVVNLKGSTLSGKMGMLSCHHWRYGIISYFEASGAVKGPFPGRFTADGQRGIGPGGGGSGFSETFTITSGSRKFFGRVNGEHLGSFHCYRFKSTALHWGNGSFGGPSSADIVDGAFRESFQ